MENTATVIRDNKDSGHIVVNFAEDDLYARADFYPPVGKGEIISREYIEQVLEKLNIVYGIHWDAIEEAMTTANLDHKQARDVLIASGSNPKHEIAEYFEINRHLQEGEKKDEAGGKIDYKAQSPFTIVKQDQVLATLQPHQEGVDGKNIHGEVTAHKTIRPEGVSGGTNTRTENNLILSNINGQLINNKGVLSVQDSLVIKGAVGYGTGNIIFPGDVVIEGPVSDGFKIYSGGSVTIKQTFDVTDVITKTDLVVSGGMIGRGQALVKVGGGLRTKFIENCRVACRKAVFVEAGIVNTSLYTLEHLEMSDKGRILGGDIYAIDGIRVGMLGKKTGKATRIHCGVDFTLEQQKEKQNNRLRLIQAKLARIKELQEEPHINSGKKAQLEELEKRLLLEQKKSADAISEILGRTRHNEKALVEVKGEIAPGTLIEICQVALFVTETLRKVRIRLDKPNGKLVSEGL